jgi:hypothetical protein
MAFNLLSCQADKRLSLLVGKHTCTFAWVTKKDCTLLY